MKSREEIVNAFESLWGDVKDSDSFPQARPKLAHYTSISTLESMLKSEALWFSNPLTMNDYSEVYASMVEAGQMLLASKDLSKACGSSDRYELLTRALHYMEHDFVQREIRDMFVFCLSLYDETEKRDGLLSMWRGYGGNGKGAAIVFDTAKIKEEPEAAIVIGKVSYMSRQQRTGWLARKVKDFSSLLEKGNIETQQLHIAMAQFYDRLRQFSVFTKHIGFSEENEWRAVYFPNRDTAKKHDKELSYAIDRHGIEPKFKLKVLSFNDIDGKPLTMKTVVHKIVVGPCLQSHLIGSAMTRMLNELNLTEICERLHVSEIPYRDRS